MNSIRQRNSSDSSTNDTTDTGGVEYYKNLNNNKDRNSLIQDDQNQLEDFVNPLFKDKATPPEYTNKSALTEDINNTPAYDQLKFNKPRRALNPQSSIQSDSGKSPEEIEMGVSNYGYNNEALRSSSWDKNLVALTPYAVNTPVRDPVDPLDARTHSLSTPEKRFSSTSKFSDYSTVSDENPYAAPSEKSPQYEDLAAMQAKRQNTQQHPNSLPPRNGKKMNMLYEPAVITSSHKEVHKTTSVGNPKGGYVEEESTSYCHVVFTILVGIIGLIALVIAFMLVFGVISAKKCEECGGTSTGEFWLFQFFSLR